MSLFVKPYQFLGVRLFLAAEPDFWPERDLRDCQTARLILGENANRLVYVGVHDQTLPGGDRQEGQHVATRQAGDERLLGIDAGLAALVIG